MRSLVALYAGVMALSLSVAVEQLVRETTGTGVEIAWGRVPVLVAFVATLIPFFHGASRYLQMTYVERRGVDMRRGALLSDFVLLFLQAVLLFVFARSMDDPRTAAATLAVLLAIDVAWGLMTTTPLLRTKRAHGLAPFRWAIVNAVALPVLGVILLVDDAPVAGDVDLTLAVALATFSLVRSAVDYWASWGLLYFPGDVGMAS